MPVDHWGSEDAHADVPRLLRGAKAFLEVKKVELPVSFTCPIGYGLMRKAHMVRGSKQTYELDEIRNWWREGRLTDPLTGEEAVDRTLVPNYALQGALTETEELVTNCNRELEKAQGLVRNMKRKLDDLYSVYKDWSEMREQAEKYKKTKTVLKALVGAYCDDDVRVELEKDGCVTALSNRTRGNWTSISGPFAFATDSFSEMKYWSQRICIFIDDRQYVQLKDAEMEATISSDYRTYELTVVPATQHYLRVMILLSSPSVDQEYPDFLLENASGYMLAIQVKLRGQSEGTTTEYKISRVRGQDDIQIEAA